MTTRAARRDVPSPSSSAALPSSRPPSPKREENPLGSEVLRRDDDPLAARNTFERSATLLDPRQVFVPPDDDYSATTARVRVTGASLEAASENSSGLDTLGGGGLDRVHYDAACAAHGASRPAFSSRFTSAERDSWLVVIATRSRPPRSGALRSPGAGDGCDAVSPARVCRGQLSGGAGPSRAPSVRDRRSAARAPGRGRPSSPRGRGPRSSSSGRARARSRRRARPRSPSAARRG